MSYLSSPKLRRAISAGMARDDLFAAVKFASQEQVYGIIAVSRLNAEMDERELEARCRLTTASRCKNQRTL